MANAAFNIEPESSPILEVIVSLPGQLRALIAEDNTAGIGNFLTQYRDIGGTEFKVLTEILRAEGYIVQNNSSRIFIVILAVED